MSGVFTPVLAKHTNSFNLIDTLSVGVDGIQRNFEPLQRGWVNEQRFDLSFWPEVGRRFSRRFFELE